MDAGDINFISNLEDTAFVINLEAHKLNKARSECCILSDQTENYIRDSEGKLLKYFGRIIYQKWKWHSSSPIVDDEIELKTEDIGKLQDWLAIVNLSEGATNGLLAAVKTLNDLVSMDDISLRTVCHSCGLTGEDKRRFVNSSRNLRDFVSNWKKNEEEPNDSELDLSWISYDRLSTPRRGDRRSESGQDSGVGSNPSLPSLPTATPPPSPGYGNLLGVGSGQTPTTPHNRWNPSALANANFQRFGPSSPALPSTSGSQNDSANGSSPRGSDKKGSPEHKNPSTPPPKWKFVITPQIKRSHSHESQLQYRINQNQTIAVASSPNSSVQKPMTLPIGSGSAGAGTPNEGMFSPSSDMPASPAISSPPYGGSNRAALLSPTDPAKSSQAPPKSPKTNYVRVMHNISHQLVKRHRIKLNESCKRCSETIGLFQSYYKCKACKQKFHEQCGLQEGPICGLPSGTEYINWFMRALENQDSHHTLPTPNRHGNIGWSNRFVNVGNVALSPTGTTPRDKISTSHSDSNIQHPSGHHGFDSSSSAESSTPSTPAPRLGPTPSPGPHSHGNPAIRQRTFTFPDVPEVPRITVENPDQNSDNPIDSISSDEKTIGPHSSMSSIHDTGVPSSLGDDNKTDSIGSGDSENHRFERNRWSSRRTNSWMDWVIQYETIKLDQPESLIGRGMFGEVHRGYWYQPIALKILNMDHIETEKQLEAFKQDVCTFRNTRHDNIVLFMGWCLTPKLAIVMNLCKGQTIYQHLYASGGKFNRSGPVFDLTRNVNIANQIAEGMSYLHGKKIIHKDLRSKNIFLENNKVVITDFGLFSMRRLCKQSDPARTKCLKVPEGWLCYLAPELIRNIAVDYEGEDIPELPFSFSSDVYAFGVIWYELLSGDLPFRRLAPDSIIWQVGRGIKPSWNPQSQILKEAREIAMQCWIFKPDDRPDFAGLVKLLEKLPKKRLARSPSHPVNMTRSAESVF